MKPQLVCLDDKNPQREQQVEIIGEDMYLAVVHDEDRPGPRVAKTIG